jgi:hypothetical protein
MPLVLSRAPNGGAPGQLIGECHKTEQTGMEATYRLKKLAERARPYILAM